MMSLKSIALGSVLYGLADRTRLGKHAVQCSIMSSTMSSYDCFHFPSCINISFRLLACTWPCVTCMFSMYSLSVTVDVVYVLVCSDVYWDPKMGGALIPAENVK